MKYNTDNFTMDSARNILLCYITRNDIVVVVTTWFPDESKKKVIYYNPSVLQIVTKLFKMIELQNLCRKYSP